jgi:hypothetical protein
MDSQPIACRRGCPRDYCRRFPHCGCVQHTHCESDAGCWDWRASPGRGMVLKVDQETGRLWASIILAVSFLSGTASVFLVQTVANLKVEQTTKATVLTPVVPPPAPATGPSPPSGPILSLVRYESMPYRVGEPLTIRMFLNNFGPNSITLYGGSHSSFVEKLPKDFNDRRKLETRLWAEAEKYKIARVRPLKFQTLITFADLMSETPLSEDQIDHLGKGAVMYMMTILKDAHGKPIITSCFHTEPTGCNLFFCTDHNSP